MSIASVFRGLAVTAALSIASVAHAGIAFQSYNPGQTPADFTSTPVNFDRVMLSGEGGTFPSNTGAWFSFTMPHAGSITGFTLPLLFQSAASGHTLNFGLWLGTGPTGSIVGGYNMPLDDIVIGELKEYSFDIPAGFNFAAGTTVTINISVVGPNSNAQIDGFLSNTPGTTHETKLGQVFDPTPFTQYIAIQIRDSFADPNAVPEPASLTLLALGAVALLRRR